MRPSRTRSLLVTAVVLALCGLGWLYLAPTQIGGSTRYVVTHGISMEPLLHTGDLVLVRPAPRYRVGQVVAYHSTLLHTVVLHRIIRIDGRHYVFKGDNNSFVDPTHPTRSQLIGTMWLHISNGGALLSWLHNPWVAAVLFGAVAMFLLYGGERRRRRRRRDRGRRGGRPTGRALPVSGPSPTPTLRVSTRHLLTASVSAVVVFAVLSLVALVLPTTKATAVSHSYVQTVRFGYHGNVRPGPVYPSGVVSTGDPIYVQLVHRIALTAAYRLTTAAPYRLHGTIRIRGTLTNTTGWSRSFWLGPPARFTGNHARAGAVISFTWLESLTNRISAQIGSGGSYALAVVPEVKVAGEIAGDPVRAAYSPALSLSLGTPQSLSGTSAIGSTTASVQPGLGQSTTRRVTSIHQTAATVAGIPVTTVRWIAISGLVLFTLLALLAGSRERESEPDPAEQINSRYKHLIVPVEPVAANPDHPPIQVSSIDALAQLAERSERLILHDHQEDVDNYLIDDQGTLFRFSAPRMRTAHLNGSGTSAGAGSAGAAGRERAANAPEATTTEAPTTEGPGGESGLSEPVASAAAAILSSAAATLSAAAAEATAAGSSADEQPAEDAPPQPQPETEARATAPGGAAGKAGRGGTARAAVPGGTARTAGPDRAAPAVEPVAAPLATGVRTRSVSHLRESGSDPRLPPTAAMAQWFRRPEYRLGLTIGPLALSFLAWRRIRARRRRRRGDDADEHRARGSWTTRNLARR